MDERTTWRKSTFSGSESNCVELPGTLDAVRDSKNTDGPVLRLDVTAFVAEVKAGIYDG
jgi:Domain of unknown function (DUF397)